MTADTVDRIQFGRFELQQRERRLLADGVPVAVGPRAFDVLVVLVQRAGHLVSKDELLEQVWRTVVVEENTLQSQVSALRKILGRDAIATVAGRGYRFTLEIVVVEPAGAQQATANNLPHYLTSFIGREREIAQLQQKLSTVRLMTLTGTGGCGKTRLAMQVASDVLHTYPDGVWLVELSALTDPLLVPQTLARVLGVKEQSGKTFTQTAVEHLAFKRALIILDNAEHVLEICAQLADAVLRRCADTRLLVTSREPLGIMGELTYRVPPLGVPDPKVDVTAQQISRCDSARLLIERARLQCQELDVTAGNAEAVASICRRLDGLPLAIELAAARVRSMSLEEVNQRLDRLFNLLTRGSSVAVPRQRTMRSLIDWSYDLLGEREQAMLRRVSVFAGGWTLANAEQVCAGDGIDAADIMAELTSLVDKSLVMTDAQAGTTRYRMLETVRQYAQDRLRECGEEARCRGNHAAWVLALALEFQNRGLLGPEQQAWLARIAGELDNVRAALAWSHEASPVDGLSMVTALDAFWRIRGHLAEARQWLDRFLDVPPAGCPADLRARGLFAAGVLAIMQGDYTAGKRLVGEAMELYRGIGNWQGAACALDALAYLAIEQGDYAEAETAAREALGYARTADDRRLVYPSLGHLAIALHRQGQWTAACELYEEALREARGVGTPWAIGYALAEMGLAECDEGRFDVAKQHLAEGLTVLHGMADRAGVIESLEGLAGVAAATGAPRRAARLWGSADAMRKEMGGATSAHQLMTYERQVETVRGTLTAAGFDQAWSEGGAMTVDDAVRFALDDQPERSD